jgi:hypothetical protein
MNYSELHNFVARMTVEQRAQVKEIINDFDLSDKIEIVFRATLNPSEVEYVRDGLPVQAIKSLRTRLKCSLFVAKRIYDKWKLQNSESLNSNSEFNF